jgi:branched-subunit amino acid transport protein
MRIRREFPQVRALHYVPPAVLSAIIIPELLIRDGSINLTLENIRLLAGIIAIITAWVSRNTLLTILIGMAALLILGLM